MVYTACIGLSVLILRVIRVANVHLPFLNATNDFGANRNNVTALIYIIFIFVHLIEIGQCLKCCLYVAGHL